MQPNQDSDSVQSARTFKAVIKAETLKSIVYIVSTVVEEVKMTTGPDGIRIKAIDSSHVAMLDVDVGKEAFISYESDGSEIGIDLEKLKAKLKLADSNDDVCLEHDQAKGRLAIKIGPHITTEMGLVDISNVVDPRVPPLDKVNFVRVSSEVLKKGIRVSESIDSEAIAITLNSESFTVVSEGDTDRASLCIPVSEVIDFKSESVARSMYPLEYLSTVVKVIPDKTEVELSLQNDFPLQVSFSFAGDSISVRYFLAPRIEDE